MTTLIPGQVLRPTDADKRVLSGQLMEMVSELEAEYSTYFNDIAVWWDFYEAKPRLKQKNFPFKHASNVVVPIIQIMADALIARTFSSIFGHGTRVWSVTTENEDKERQSKDMARYINWQARGNDFDYPIAVYD